MNDQWGYPIQSGPCVVCGDTNYSLSMGGPTICPPCDCGPPSPRKVREMREELVRLRAELSAIRMKEVSDRGWKFENQHLGPHDGSFES